MPERARDIADTVLATISHTFYYSEVKRLGLEYETWWGDATGSVMKSAATQYAVVDAPWYATTGTWFVAPVTQTTYLSGAIGTSPYQRTEHRYGDYGNLTATFERGLDTRADDQRSTHRAFYANTTAWIVNKPAWENVYEGITENVGGTALKTQTLLYYDGASTWGATPVRGQLTRIDRGGGSTFAIQRASYDLSGDVSTITDTRDYTTTATYDANGWSLTAITNAANQATTYTYYWTAEWVDGVYQPYGALKSIIDPNNATTLYSYDLFGRLKKVAQPYDSFSYPTEQWWYYDNGDAGLTAPTARSGNLNPLLIQHFTRRQSGAGANGGWWTTSWGVDVNATATWERTFYDGLGRAVQTQRPNATWNPANGGTSADGEVVVNTAYDALGHVLSQTVPYAASQYVYGTTNGLVNNPYLAPDWGRPQTQTQYDALGRTMRVTGPDGAQVTTIYTSDASGVRSIAFDANGHRRDSVTDGLGRLRAVDEYIGQPQVFEAEGASLAHFIGSSTGSAWQSPAAGANANWLTYGPYQAPLVAGIGQVARFRLSIDSATGANDLVAIIDVSDWTAGNVQIARRELRRQEFVGGIDAYSEFDLAFDTTGRTGHQMEYRVYWMGVALMRHDRTSIIWRDPGQTQTTLYAYDALGSLTRVTDTLGNTTVITYDALSRKTAMADPDMGRWSYGYDANGNLTSQTDAKNQALTFTYDALNRMTGKFLGSTRLVTYTYDAGTNGKGRRTSMSNVSAATTWSYDMRGRVITEGTAIAGAGAYTTVYGYDAADRVITMTYPSGEVVRTAYNVAAQSTALTGTVVYVSNATYNALGQTRQITYGNTLGARYTYWGIDFIGSPAAQNYGRLRRVCVITQTVADCPDGSAGSSLLNIAYGYDAVGNITNIGDRTMGQGLAFSYDTLDRLTAFGIGGVNQESYTYDAIGDLRTKTGVGTLNYPASGANSVRPHAVSSTSSGHNYTYDANGNMTRRVELSGTQWMTYSQGWDVENRLITATWSGQVVSYTYDADGALVKKVAGGVTTAYAGAHYEVNTSTGVTTSYYSFGGQRVAMRQGATVTWLHGDHLGSASLATNASGGVVANSVTRYTPFGSYRSGYTGSGLSTDRRFTGQREQASIGLYDYGARMYDPLIGRFISADTLVPSPGDPQSLNRYAYVRNSPLAHIDPSGHVSDCPTNMCYGVDLWGYSHSSVDSGQSVTALQVQQEGIDLAYQAGQAGLQQAGDSLANQFANGLAQELSHTGSGTSGPGGMGSGGFGGDGVARLEITAEKARSIAIMSQSFERSGTTVLGRFGDLEHGIADFREVAQHIGANAMNVPNAVWNQYSSAAQWAINRAFLDLAIERGDTFRLSASYAEQKEYTNFLLGQGKGFLDLPGFSKELDYMEQLGYKLVEKVIDGQVVEFLEKSK